LHELFGKVKHEQKGGDNEQHSPTSSPPRAEPRQNLCAKSLSDQEQHDCPNQGSYTSNQKKPAQREAQKPSRKIRGEASSRHQATENQNYVPTLTKPTLALLDPIRKSAQRASLKPITPDDAGNSV
jgi:hypothetical protein